MCILYNDWPYGLDPKIVHLVVWTKFSLEDDEDTGELTKETRTRIDRYVDETFKARVPAENVSIYNLFQRWVSRVVMALLWLWIGLNTLGQIKF